MQYCVRRTSQLTGITRDRFINVDPDQIVLFNRGALVQEAFPQLSAEEREFLLTGITGEEWDEMLGSEEE